MNENFPFEEPPTTEESHATIQVSDLALGYPARGGGAAFAALEGVSFSVPEGSVTAVLGESGSGKSTLARVLAGRAKQGSDRRAQVNILSGNVDLNRRSLTASKRKHVFELAHEIGYVQQDAGAGLRADLTIAEILLEPLSERYKRFNPEDYAEWISRLLEAIALTANVLDQFPHQLSKGQRQRIAVIRALVMSPRVLILDEPTMGIDPNNRPRVIELLKQYQREHNATMLVVSHDISLLETLVDDVIILQQGSIVGRGAINEIFNNAEHDYVQRLADALRSTAYDEAYEG